MSTYCLNSLIARHEDIKKLEELNRFLNDDYFTIHSTYSSLKENKLCAKFQSKYTYPDDLIGHLTRNGYQFKLTYMIEYAGCGIINNTSGELKKTYIDLYEDNDL